MSYVPFSRTDCYPYDTLCTYGVKQCSFRAFSRFLCVIRFADTGF